MTVNVLDKNIVLVSGAIVFKEGRGKPRWFIVRQNEENGWEVPKILVRKGESSVRAALRMMGEKGAMTTKVLSEAGRAGGVTSVNGKVLPQRELYYLMRLRAESGEPVGFKESLWLPYAKAVRKMSSKRERSMIKSARKEYRKWKKEMKRKAAEEKESNK
jgi:DNA-binding GntR family transcriptional regulator